MSRKKGEREGKSLTINNESPPPRTFSMMLPVEVSTVARLVELGKEESGRNRFRQRGVGPV